MTRSPYATKHPLLVLPVVVRKSSKLPRKLLKHQPPDFHMLEKLEREWTSHGSNSMWHSICTNKHTGFSMVIQLENLDIDSSQALGHAVSLLFHANVLPPCSANQTHETPKSPLPNGKLFLCQCCQHHFFNSISRLLANCAHSHLLSLFQWTFDQD